MYENAYGVRRSYVTAAKWYKKAAEQLDNKAHFNLGLAYKNGEGVTKNLVKAYCWYTVAVKFGHSYAHKNRAKIEKKMTPAQIKKAKESATQWIMKHKQK